MKRTILTILFATLCFSWQIARAETNSGTCGSNLTWVYDSETTILEISGSGSMNDFYSDVSSPWYSFSNQITEVWLPSGLTRIGKYAFSGCSSLTSVTIPNSVTSIESDAFNNCSSLTSITIPNSVTSIGSDAFSHCSSLSSVTIPNSVTRIGRYAFSYCTGLTSVTIPNSVTTIDYSAFYNCTGLTSVYISDLAAWYKIYFESSVSNPLNYAHNLYLNGEKVTNLVFPDDVTEIKNYAFSGCSSLTSITIPNSVTSIGSYAFSGCSSLASVTIPNSVTSIGSDAFYGCKGLGLVILEGVTPPTLGTTAFSNTPVSIVVPAAAVDTYKNDANWTTYASKIVSADYAILSLDVTAEEGASALLKEIGDANTQSVVDLTIKGSINSYDVIILRDKMPNLRHLDISEAAVVASSKAFYETSCTGENDLGNDAFRGLSNLLSVKLPKDLVRIGNYMFNGCEGLTSVTIPNSVTSIGTHAFNGCKGLTDVTIPNSVTSIGQYAFYDCYSLKEIKLPPTLQTIGSSAFYRCYSLTEVRLPSSVLSVASNAFSGCNAIKNVYTYTIEPTSIVESTFSSTAFQNAMLHVPSTSYWNYYWDDGWKRFLNLTYFDEPYDYFYLNNDYTLDEETGYIDGTPDVDINAGGGLVVEGETSDNEDVKQELGDVNINHDGSGTSGSIIGDNNVHADNLNIRINIKGGRWYFFAFPFDIPFSKISMENGTQYVFRYYDGEERAKNGKGGWKDINENHLKAARGYIFQAATDDVLVLNIADVRFKKEDKYNELVEHVTENLQDASWNFTGNPYLSYYDINNLGYDAPITIWNGSSYEAIRPGDDDYHFAPFEAFFVQKPEDKGSVDFEGDHQKTHKKAQATQAANAAKRAGASVATDRKLVNIAISGENAAADRTRVVFNDKQSLAYETACDAVKFESDAAAQLYTLDNKNVRYAINERPVGNGTVPVGVKFANGGRYTISAERMDTAVLLKDEKTGTVHNLAEGAYTFIADAGTDEARFALVFNGGTTGIEGAVAADAVAAVDGGVNIENAAGAVVEIYTAAGAVVVSDVVSGYVALPAGAYIVKINGNSIKVAVK